MSDELDELSIALMIQQQVDRRIMTVMLRAVLATAPPSSRQMCRQFLSVLREQYESGPPSPDDVAGRQHGIALRHFEKWEEAVDEMLEQLETKS